MKNSKHKILVVIDVQNDFINGTLANKIAEERVSNIVKKINEFDGDYIYVTRDTHGENYLETKEGKNLPVPHCIKGTDGWLLRSEIANALINKDVSERYVITFINKSTFDSIELAKKIDSIKGELDIEVVGFCTDICVISNVFLIKAFVQERGDITVDASCCAGVTKESHEAALLTMKMCQINVINE